MRSGTLQIHFLDLQIAPRTRIACLSPAEISRAERFRFRPNAESWVACRLGLREILGQTIGLPPQEVPLVFAEFGKPCLAPPYDALHFNVSHTDELALVALCGDGPVGVDLEPLNRAASLIECETTFCHPVEISDLPTHPPERACRLLRIWTAKEAVLKALGTGLSHPPEAVWIVFEPPPGRAVSEMNLPGIETQRLYPLADSRLANYRATASVPFRVSEIEYF